MRSSHDQFPTCQGATPLHKAVAKGHGNVAELLLGQGAAVDIKDKKGHGLSRELLLAALSVQGVCSQCSRSNSSALGGLQWPPPCGRASVGQASSHGSHNFWGLCTQWILKLPSVGFGLIIL